MSAVSRVTFYRDAGGKWRWRFSRNGNVMADSGQGYSRRVDCVRAAEVVLDGICNDASKPTALARPNSDRLDSPWEYLPVAVLKQRRQTAPTFATSASVTTWTPPPIFRGSSTTTTWNAR